MLTLKPNSEMEFDKLIINVKQTNHEGTKKR